MNIFFLIMKYMWFIGVLFWGVNTLQAWLRMSRVLKEHPEWEGEAKAFLKGYFMFFAIPALLLGLLQLAGGYDNPFYVFARSLNIFVVLSWCIVFSTWVIIFHYVFLQDGARQLVKLNVLGGRMPASESLIKVIVIIMLVGALCALAFGVTYDIGSAVP